MMGQKPYVPDVLLTMKERGAGGAEGALCGWYPGADALFPTALGLRHPRLSDDDDKKGAALED
jgi:hypothetical protein